MCGLLVLTVPFQRPEVLLDDGMLPVKAHVPVMSPETDDNPRQIGWIKVFGKYGGWIMIMKQLYVNDADCATENSQKRAGG